MKQQTLLFALLIPFLITKCSGQNQRPLGPLLTAEKLKKFVFAPPAIA